MYQILGKIKIANSKYDLFLNLRKKVFKSLVIHF